MSCKYSKNVEIMKYAKLLIMLTVMLVITTASAQAQGWKIMDSSQKKQPEWLGKSSTTYMTVSCEDKDLEAARRRCMQALYVKIVEGIATNISSSYKESLQNELRNDDVTTIGKSESKTTVIAARLPFLSGISETKIRDSYWEKRQDKKTRQITYMAAIQYGITERQLQLWREQFKELDAKMDKKLNDLDNLAKNIGKVEDIDNGAASCQELISFFLDEQRQEHARKLQNEFQAMYRQLSLVGEEREGKWYLDVMLHGHKITCTRTMKLASKCADDMRATCQDGGYIVTFTCLDCLKDEVNTVEAAVSVGTIKLKYTIPIKS